MLNPNKSFLVYAIPFLLIFNFYFLPGLTDGHQTTVVFALSSFIQVGLTFILYRLLIFILKKSKKELPNWTYGIVLYLLSECVIFIISGEIALFGISYKLHLKTDPTAHHDILLFRQQRCFAFSMSFLIASVICSVITMFGFKEKNTNKNINNY